MAELSSKIMAKIKQNVEEIYEEDQTILIIRTKTHYGD